MFSKHAIFAHSKAAFFDIYCQ